MTYADGFRQIPPIPHNDPEPQAAGCPTCGRQPVPYDQRKSALLDAVLLLEAVVADLKKAAEEIAS